MSVAINISSILAPAVQARGEKPGDNSKAATAFDSMLGTAAGRDASKRVPTPAEGSARPAWAWSGFGQPPEDGNTPALPGDAIEELAKGQIDAAMIDAESAADQPEPETSGDEGGDETTELAAISPAPQIEAEASLDDAKAPEKTEARSAPTDAAPRKSGWAAGKDLLGREMAAVAQPDPRTVIGTARQALRAGTVEPRGDSQRAATDLRDTAKPASGAVSEPAGLQRPPITRGGEARGDLRARAETPRSAPPANTAAQRASMADAAIGSTVADSDAEARLNETRGTRWSNLTSPSRLDARSQDPISQRATVISSQTAPVAPPAPAPAQLGTSMPSSQVVTAIREEAEQISRAAAAALEAQQNAPARARPLHTIQIQLQPADLGRVTARLSLEGSALRVELQVETGQARAQLAKEVDSMLKSLKSAGFEIDRVTVQQVQPGSNSSATANQERGGNPLASQNSGSDEAGEQRRQRSAGHHGGSSGQEGNDGKHQNDARGGLFI